MQKFARHKTLDEIEMACREVGFALDTTEFDKGSDHVKIAFVHDGETFDVLYNTFNGRFFGPSRMSSDGYFTSDDASLDATPWFQALLNFFYVPMAEG